MQAWPKFFEHRIAPLGAWRSRLGPDFEVLAPFLAPTGSVANFLPCPRSASTGCGWKVNPETGDGVCPEGRCDPISVDPSECAMMGVDMPGLCRALGRSLDLVGEPEQNTQAGLLGWVMPVQSARYPVFYCFPHQGQSALGLIQRCAERAADGCFVLVAASASQLDPDCFSLLGRRKAVPIFLDETVGVIGAGKLDAAQSAARIAQFALESARVDKPEEVPKFPTPANAAWSDLTITAENEFTIKIVARVVADTGVVECARTYGMEALGMGKTVHGEMAPDTNWDFLRKLINHKRVCARSEKAWAQCKTAKKKVSRILGALTGLDPRGAITDYRGLKCYEACFQVECERGQECLPPGEPRKTNDRGEEVWMNGRPITIPRTR